MPHGPRRDADAGMNTRDRAKAADAGSVTIVVLGHSVRESQALAHRFGNTDGRPRRIADIARAMGVSWQRAKVIHESAMSKVFWLVEARAAGQALSDDQDRVLFRYERYVDEWKLQHERYRLP